MSKAQLEALNTTSNSYEPIAKDTITGAMKQIDIIHAIIHDGRGFTCSNITSMANGEVRDIIIYNPTNNEAHLRVYEVDIVNAPARLYLYEGPFTVTASGVLCANENNARGSSNVSSVAVYDVASVTITSSSTRLEAHLLTGGKHSGGSTPAASIEWELASNQRYLVRIDNQSGQATDAAFYFFWVQPEGS